MKIFDEEKEKIKCRNWSTKTRKKFQQTVNVKHENIVLNNN